MILIFSLITFVILLFLYPKYISWQKKMKYGQHIRKEGPDLHNYKEGTPTSGGLLFTVAISINSFLFFFVNSNPIFLIIGLSAFLFGFIGFLDDFISVLKKDSTGLKAYQKLILQLFFSLIIFLVIRYYNYNSEIIMPFTNLSIDLKFIYPIWVILFISSMSNATNLTDGLDGLSSGTFVISSFFTVIAAYKLYNVDISIIYLLILPVAAFMVYNIKPAKIFMGDSGSLALGGILGSFAVYYSMEIFLIFTCFIFIIEFFSVVLQVLSFKIRKKRLFLMAPIHHHFELKKWSEERVVMFFWFINFLIGIFAVGG
jgi:phospho-N-acetylmuramoyl-pentapeptide-transferase